MYLLTKKNKIMRKQLLGLLTLISMMIMYGGSSAWAQTDVKAVWFNASAETDATITSTNDTEINSKFSVKGATISTSPVEFKLNNTRSGCKVNGQTETVTTTNVQVPAGTTVTNSTEMIAFTLTPENGITLTPTSITLYAGIQSFGDKKTNSKNKFVNYVVYSGETVVAERTDIELGRNDSGTGITPVSINLNNVSCDAANSLTIKLFLKGYSQSSAKNILLSDITVNGTVSGTVQETNKYSVTTNVMPEKSGTVTLSPAAEKYNEGSNITLSAAAATGYKFVNWTSGDDVLGTEIQYTISGISKDENITANFRKLPVVTFTSTEEGVEGKDVVYNTLDNGETITIPVNNKRYLAGKTLIGWNDGEKTYKPGDVYTVNGDATLNGVFEDNAFSLSKPSADVVVKWSFNAKEDGATINCEGSSRPSDIYVTQVTHEGKTIDVKMDVDASTGKCNNENRENAQTRNTIFTIPAAKGCEITFAGTNDINVSTIDGETVTPSGKTWTYTYNGSNSTIAIATGATDTYYTSIEVKYKKPQSYTLTTEDADFYGLYLDYAVNIPEGVTAYTGKLNAEETTLTVEEIEGNVIPAGCGVLVKSDAAGEFTFTETDEAAAEAASDLKGVTAATDITALAETGKAVLTLGIKEGVVAFRQPAGSQIMANKTYLLVNEASAAKGVKIAFGGDTTGISDINATETEANAPVYNLAGQRVGNGTKGLLIKNGRKFINK